MFNDKWIVITGGAGGIGMATAEAFLAQGARLLLIDTAEDRLAQARAALADPERVLTWCSTLATPQDCAAALGRVDGGLHALVHLAGVFEKDGGDKADHSVWDRAMAHNLTNAYDMCRAFLPRRGPGACVVLASSIAYRRGGPENLAYSAAKGGIVGLTRALSRQIAPDARANAIAPGIIETGMTTRIIAERGPHYTETIPLRRYGRASEVATVIRFLCSEDSSYITGQTITIDGGITNA